MDTNLGKRIRLIAEEMSAHYSSEDGYPTEYPNGMDIFTAMGIGSTAKKVSDEYAALVLLQAFDIYRHTIFGHEILPSNEEMAVSIIHNLHSLGYAKQYQAVPDAA